MLKQSSPIILILFLSAGTISAQQSQETLTKADYDRAVQMLGFNTSKKTDRSRIRPQWLPDGRFWYQASVDGEDEFIVINPAKGNKETASSKDALLGDIEEKPRGRYTEIPSPDGTKVAYIKDWNLWVRNIATGKEKALTTDGVKDFGYATDNAGWKHSDRPILLWSPDSKKIATFQQDQRHVKDMYLVSTNVGAPSLEQWKYPLPGDEEIIKIHRVIIEVDGPKVIRLNMGPDPHRGTLCDDISCSGSFDDNQWSEDGKYLAFVSSSRDHKVAALRLANASTGEVQDVYTEKVDTQYESGQGSINWKFLPGSNEFIWYSERDDWGHLYLYDLKTGELKNQITRGDFVVTEVLKVDKKKRTIYFEAKGREPGNPYFTHFYSIDFKGKKLRHLTPEEGDHNISLSPEGKYFVDNYSQPNVPNVAVLRSIDGKLVMSLEKEDISRLKEIGWKAPIPFTVRSADEDFDLYGLMYTPTDLDERKKYPVINYIYPGPQGGSVGYWSFSSSRGDHQALAELGFVVVTIEGSCNPNRSKSFHDKCYGDMAQNTLPDQISGLKQLAQKYSYMDLEKVGLWGHSGGGFATASALFKYPEFYKVGISESGNHDNRNYEDDWGERYIGLLEKSADGSSNYEIQANQLHAENLEGKLLLVHGGMDDNVPPYNTYLVVEALIEANKDFDLLIFPNARHGYRQHSLYMMRRRWDYFVENLKGAVPPDDYAIEYKRD